MPVPTIDVSGIVDATIASASKWLTPFNNIKTFLTDLTAGNAGVPVERLLWGTQSASISGTTLSAITKKYVIVDTDGSASQNLATISGPVQGHEVVLEMANAARVVTVKHGTGNIFLWGGADVTLAVGKVLHLFRTSTGWSDVFIPNSLSLASLYDQTNIVPNSSFEAWERGIAAAPDNWTLAGAGATIAQETSTIYHGASSAKVTRVGADVTFTADIYSRFGKTYPRSKQITFTAWVWSATANIARLRINDGVTITQSSYHPGSSAWVKLSVTATVGAAISALNVGLEINTTNGLAYMDAVAVAEGPNIVNYTPDLQPFNQFPRRASMWHDEALVVAGNALTITANASQMFNALVAQTAAAVNDAFTHGFWLAAGTYTFSVFGETSSDRGRIDWYLDGVNFTTNQDWYTAGATFNVTKTVASVIVAYDGWHVLKGIVATKNGSSSGFAMVLNKYWFRQAAD